MFPVVVLNSVIAALALALPATAAPQNVPKNDTPELSLTAQLRLADTAVQRYALLPKDEDFTFDFSKDEIPIASPVNFPALVGSGMTFSMTSLPACNMAFLHLHPRATEIFGVHSGRIIAEMVPEAGVTDSEGKQRVIRSDLREGMMTVFPAGSFHTQLNPECEPANITAAFSSEDIGAAAIASQVFALSDDVISHTFGGTIAGEEIDTIRDAIPENIVIEVEQCLKKCGKEKRQL